MSDPYKLAHSLAIAVHPFNHLVEAATDQAYLIIRLQDEVKQLREQRDEAIKQRDEARRVAYCLTVELALDDDLPKETP